MPRFRCALLLMAALIAAAPAAAQFKPTRPVELVVHSGPGSGSDVVARAMVSLMEQQKLTPVPLRVVNKAGGGSAVAMSYLAEKQGDPHVLGFFAALWITQPLVSAEVKVTIRDLSPVARLIDEPALIVVRGDAPYKTLADFIDAAKKAPGQLKQSGGSVSGRDNVIRQVIQKATGAQWSYISYPSGGERVSALLGGHVNLIVMEPQEASQHLRAGSIRPLALVAEKRLAGFPGVPTLAEAGVKASNVPQVRGIVAPPGVSRDALAYWEEVFSRLSKSAEWRKFIADSQFEGDFIGGSGLGVFFDEFSAQMREVFREAGIKVVR